MQKDLRILVATIAREVRDWVEQEDNKREYPTKDLNGWCAIASAQLSRRLSREGVDHMLCIAEAGHGCHVFVIVEDHIVDVTATQFMEFERHPVVILHEREAALHWYHRVSQVFTKPGDLRKYQRKQGWPAEQTAYA